MQLSRSLTPRAAMYVLAAILAAAVADSVYRIPIQVSDSLDAIVEARTAPSAAALFLDASAWSGTTLRPMRYLQARWLADVAEATGLSYHAVFRGVHAAMAIAIVLIAAAILPVTRWRDVAAGAIAMTVLLGIHTFAAMFREAFPVNHFAETALAALVVMRLAQKRPRWFTTPVALGLLIFCLLLIESAVLIWVVILTCAWLGFPGLSWRTAIAATAVLALYAGARWQFEVSSPGIGAHGTGYGGDFYGADDVRARFADNPVAFRAYNVAGGSLSVLLSEPRFGVYSLVRRARGEPVSPVVPLNVVSSLALTVPLLLYLVRVGLRPSDPADRIAIVAVVVLAASAALCFNYIKDDILTTAGVFYALAVFAPVRALLDYASLPSRQPLLVAGTCLFLVAVGAAWAFRAAGLHYLLRYSAYTARNEWAYVLKPGKQPAEEETPADRLAIARRLKNEAISVRSASPAMMPRWADRYWVE